MAKARPANKPPVPGAPRGRVFGHLKEIDYRTHVGTEAWKRRHPPRIRKLSALRRAHMLEEHPEFKQQLQALGLDLARDATPAQLVKIVRDLEASP